jgi:hypothetical protein
MPGLGPDPHAFYHFLRGIMSEGFTHLTLFCTISLPYSHCAEMRFGVGADVGEAGGIGHARGLAGFGVGPALALLEFDGVIVQQLIYRH